MHFAQLLPLNSFLSTFPLNQPQITNTDLGFKSEIKTKTKKKRRKKGGDKNRVFFFGDNKWCRYDDFCSFVKLSFYDLFLFLNRLFYDRVEAFQNEKSAHLAAIFLILKKS